MEDIFDFGFFDIHFFDVVDILLVSIIIYQIYRLIRGTIAVNIFIGLLCVYLFWFIVKSLDMTMITGILDKIIGVGTLAFIIVFQQEIRRFLLVIGKNASSNRNSFLNKFFFKIPVNEEDKLKVKALVDACESMARSQIGALIVITKSLDEQIYIGNGETLNANISKRLIESVFSKSSPLHDGAIIICDNKIALASCVLPLTENTDLPDQFGLRHRSAMGITENSDAVAIVVSEETGQIAYSTKGKLKTNIKLEDLKTLIQKDMI
jgi:uncharacterized protein (TIGR00159 family)